MKFPIKIIVIGLYFIVIFNAISLNAQSDYIKDRLSIQLGHSIYQDFGKKLLRTNSIFGMSDYRLAVNYGLTKTIEVGLYGGIARLSNFAIGDTSGSIVYSPSPSYGVQAQFQILPYIVNSSDFRFDVYVKGSVGLRMTNNRINEANNGTFPEYGAGLGAAFYVFPNVGLFGEYTYGKFNTVRHTLQRNSLRYGLVLKF